jgi:hypothetical protein
MALPYVADRHFVIGLLAANYTASPCYANKNINQYKGIWISRAIKGASSAFKNLIIPSRSE